VLIPNNTGSCYKLLVIFQGLMPSVVWFFLKANRNCYTLNYCQLLSIKTETTSVVYVYGLHI